MMTFACDLFWGPNSQMPLQVAPQIWVWNIPQDHHRYGQLSGNCSSNESWRRKPRNVSSTSRTWRQPLLPWNASRSHTLSAKSKQWPRNSHYGAHSLPTPGTSSRGLQRRGWPCAAIPSRTCLNQERPNSKRRSSRPFTWSIVLSHLDCQWKFRVEWMEQSRLQLACNIVQQIVVLCSLMLYDVILCFIMFYDVVCFIIFIMFYYVLYCYRMLCYVLFYWHHLTPHRWCNTVWFGLKYLKMLQQHFKRFWDILICFNMF